MSNHPDVVIAHVDERLIERASALFWATFPRRRLGQASVRHDGRVVLTSDAPWTSSDAQRWLSALDQWMLHAENNILVREVGDQAGQRVEIFQPLAPDAYSGGTWVVGPFDNESQADAWARATLEHPWVHDVITWHRRTYADVFSAALPSKPVTPLQG